METKHLLMTFYISLLDPYLQYMISTFNTCSQGLTYWCLTDTGGDYKLGDVSLPHHTPRPSQLTVLRFPLKGPIQSHVKQPIISNGTKEEANHKSRE
jgi:hypothetical protein